VLVLVCDWKRETSCTAAGFFYTDAQVSRPTNDLNDSGYRAHARRKAKHGRDPSASCWSFLRDEKTASPGVFNGQPRLI
jgi:hypothetical protein